MSNKIIKTKNYEWKYPKITESVTDENIEGYFYSWGEFSTPTIYTRCNGNSLSIRKCTLISQIFIECDFRGVDASDSKFIDCLFLNCLFEKANFHKSSFVGTAILQDKEEFYNEKFNAGVSQTKFKSSELNKSILSHLKLDGCNFRHAIFENTIFDKVSIKYTSFEDAYLANCIINTLDLRHSACRGIIVTNCKITEYISSLEKTLGAIGALQTLESCDKISLSSVSDTKINNLYELKVKLKEVSQKFLAKGKLFEFLNIMNFLHTQSETHAQNYIISSKELPKISVQNGTVNGYPISEKGRFLYKITNSAYETISNNGCVVSLDDILYSLKLMFFLNINEYSLLKFLLDIYKNEVLTSQNDYADFLVLSQINHYFQVIGSQIKSNRYRITFHNEKASWQDREDRNNFYEFCKDFIYIATENKDFKLISMHEGSIDAVFDSFVVGINGILIAATILGIRFQYKGGEVNFEVDASKGIKSYGEFLKTIASIIPFLGDNKPTLEEFERISKETRKVIEKLGKYIAKNIISGNILQKNATEEIEEVIKEIRLIDTKDNKIFTQKETIKRRKISNN